MRDLGMDQVIRIQCEVMSGRSWEDRSDKVRDTAEAHAKWDAIARDVAKIDARGNMVDIPFD